jgi:hypothetical protein
MIRLLLKIFSKQTLAEFLSEKADEIIEYIEPEQPRILVLIREIFKKKKASS